MYGMCYGWPFEAGNIIWAYYLLVRGRGNNTGNKGYGIRDTFLRNDYDGNWFSAFFQEGGFMGYEGYEDRYPSE